MITDVNFRNKLISSYPSVMTGIQLNIAAAHGFTNDLILTGANISNLDGIQFFTSVYKIDASFNNLTSLPSISTLTQLKYLYVNFNQLTSLPNLNNQLSLIELQASNNALTSVPNLSQLLNLNILFLTNNNITNLPDISTLINLKSLIIGNNPFTTLPDFSPNNQLLELHVHQTNSTQIKGLSQLTKLTKLYCWNNSITDLSDLSSNTTLTGLFAFSNKLNQLPTLTNKPNLNSVEIADNYLTFEDLLPLAGITTLSDFSYSPQDSVGIHTNVSVREYSTLALSFIEDAAITNNTYTWYKGNQIISTNQTQALNIPKASKNNEGAYYVKYTNPILPALTLTHRIWDVILIPCFDIQSYSFNILSNECSLGATVHANIVLNGGTAPYSYKLTQLNTTDTLTNNTGDYNQIAPGNYSFIIRDSNNCTIERTEKIIKPAKCDPVITPNGDILMSSYFIEQTGDTKIIDLQGKTILQFKSPAVWYGTKADGTLADAGFYVIIVNDKKITNITVIR
ncbi:LRR-like protein [uncultured Cytophaga sp.]|uniref:leucine-rich repeat domain-containing protein n=1 Tax=uncultured Cytophaga sp. TaxID=160238 RepID=UPI00260D526D|nr:LRR-like protein [uncultured Cytophaga sp.]